MPSAGELVTRLLAWVGELINASSLRVGLGPTVATLVVLLTLLSLVARPSSRWVTRDAGKLTGLGRSMALAAEAGATATLSVGTAGVARAASAAERMQSLVVLPLVEHVARTAARAGVPLHITTNDPVVAGMAEALVTDAHAATGTSERRQRSDVEFLGEGRVPAAGLSLGADARRVAGFALGGLGDESLLLAHGMAAGATGARVGSGDVAQAPSILLEGTGTLVGADLYAAPAEVRSTGHARPAVVATNRLIGAVIVILVLAAAWAVAGGSPADLLSVR
ncbi:MAG: DUF6754 domain-containing protein [Chloroflexota bacterium]